MVAIPVLVIGWFGFVPGVSSLLGATKARDLGVNYSDQDYASYLKKTGTTFSDLSTAPEDPTRPGKKVIFDNPKTVQDLQLTQEELTAAVNESNWLWMPLKNTQIRLGDNTVEVSGNLNLEYLDEFISFIGGVDYSQKEVEDAVSWAQRFANNAPVYIKSSVSIENSTLNMTISEARLGRFSMPLDSAGRAISAGTTHALNKTPNFEATSAYFYDGILKFSGTYPSTVYIKTK